MFTKRETNFCKGIAIILMLFHHLFNDFEEYAGYVVNYSPFTAERIHFFALVSRICVAIFVFLSGYGIAATYRNKFGKRVPSSKEVVQFTWNRYWKLMTGYWVAFFLTILCQPFGRTVFDAYGTGTKDLVLCTLIDFFGLANLIGTPTLNPTWWYMSMAFSIIILMPLIMRLMQEFGAVLVTIGGIVVLSLLNASNPNTFYLFSLLLGALCLEFDLFGKISGLGQEHKYSAYLKFVCEAVILLGLLAYRTNYNYFGIVDGLISMMLALLACLFTKLTVISSAMEFLGKHSANMFLIHNQLYSFYFLGFFYSFKYWFLILLVLTVVSLAVSVGMELVKQRSGYSSHMKKLGEVLLVKILEFSGQ